jgi:hypothetical protein
MRDIFEYPNFASNLKPEEFRLLRRLERINRIKCLDLSVIKKLLDCEKPLFLALVETEVLTSVDNKLFLSFQLDHLSRKSEYYEMLYDYGVSAELENIKKTNFDLHIKGDEITTINQGDLENNILVYLYDMGGHEKYLDLKNLLLHLGKTYGFNFIESERLLLTLDILRVCEYIEINNKQVKLRAEEGRLLQNEEAYLIKNAHNFDDGGPTTREVICGLSHNICSDIDVICRQAIQTYYQGVMSRNNLYEIANKHSFESIMANYKQENLLFEEAFFKKKILNSGIPPTWRCVVDNIWERQQIPRWNENLNAAVATIAVVAIDELTDLDYEQLEERVEKLSAKILRRAKTWPKF